MAAPFNIRVGDLVQKILIDGFSVEYCLVVGMRQSEQWVQLGTLHDTQLVVICNIARDQQSAKTIRVYWPNRFHDDPISKPDSD